MDRDRDARGRAHNARPRDRTGRPLPPGAEGVPRVPDDLELTPAQALVQAQQFLDDDLPFQAHEVFEAMWKQRRDAGVDDAGMWQGLAQIAVGLTHLQRRNTAGAVALLRRGAGNLDGHPAAALQSWAEQVAGAIEAGAGSPVELLAARPELR